MFERLREIRKEAGVSGETMAGVLHLKTRGGYSKKENGVVPFTLDEAKAIASYFNKSIDEIFYVNEVS